MKAQANRFKDKWHRHSVAVPTLTRTYRAFKRTMKGTVELRNVVEMVYIHDVYRPVTRNAKGKRVVSKRKYHRGAFIGMAA